MLKTYTAKNGKIITYSALTYAVTVQSAEGKQEMAFTLLHPHFDDGVIRNAMGTYDRESRSAIQEFLANELDIESITFARKDGARHRRDLK